MVDCGWACRRVCRSIVFVCMPLVFSVRAVIAGWVKGVGGLGVCGACGIVGEGLGVMWVSVSVVMVWGWVVECGARSGGLS